MRSGLKSIALLYALTIGCSLSGKAEAASFDCSKASTTVERSICASPELSSLDDEMAKTFRAALAKGGEAIRPDQRIWMNQRNSCRDSSCLLSAYKNRLDVLRDSMNITTRSTTPQQVQSPLKSEAGKDDRLIGSWDCEQSSKGKPSHYKAAFFPDGTHINEFRDGGGHVIFVTGGYTLKENNLNVGRTIAMAVNEKSGAAITEWRRSSPNADYTLTNHRILDFQLTWAAPNKVLLKGTHISGGIGSRTALPHSEPQVCVRSDSQFERLKRVRATVPTTLY